VKTILFYSLSAAIIFLFFSCQKEIHFDFVSEGTLEKDLNNNCLGTVNGNYVIGKNLDADNYIEAHVHITARGSYSISTDTVNGYSFSASGDFKDTGSVLVKLTGHGKPNSVGSDQFNVAYKTSRCQVVVTVLNVSTTAAFTLQGSPGACMIDTVTGTYIQGYSLDTSNKIKIRVNVTIPGSYEILTDTVNGYSFSSSGTFLTTGIQTISLTGSGMPVNNGTDMFTVKAGSSICNFPVTVFTIVTVTNNDHFPLTMSSYWDYTDLYYHGNIITNIVIDTVTKNGNLYRSVMEEISPGGPVILYYRKTGINYFEYAAVDKYTSSFQYAKKIHDDLPFLTEGLRTGSSWQSKEYSDTASFGQVIGLQYDYSCLDAGNIVVINGHAFADVYKVQMKPKIKGASNIYAYTGEIYLYYYAKGIGLIYYKKINLGVDYGEWQIKDWQVN
jgi:hypothetical protein